MTHSCRNRRDGSGGGDVCSDGAGSGASKLGIPTGTVGQSRYGASESSVGTDTGGSADKVVGCVSVGNKDIKSEKEDSFCAFSRSLTPSVDSMVPPPPLSPHFPAPLPGPESACEADLGGYCNCDKVGTGIGSSDRDGDDGNGGCEFADSNISDSESSKEQSDNIEVANY